ncbi:von Willebrand factor A domain-containing protein 5A-like [Paramacrobiotus metropolitanus]|uniref:von Willebrand factor A domain-containing protein 5A-like n=1 Tax=Paramacrobiotus metropolitanus TaxID=2943436 RepID=UPI0024456E6C|nr:von Willebrand factor A domain-containing protein 5A-like [Paramacrobiotus metropolitanus]XP_055344234.1 von Willebrand factor A domain-containing protein 5A-like [Paramacrobiotus metropolitanus]XP_055344242.1 von Willebrand factor A domain-containing protein 5A-like [Paramacrobiotus metropolitanus]
MEESCCGLFVAESNEPIPLTAIHYEVDVKGFAGSITINQTFKNVEFTDLECVYGFPMNDQAAVMGFTVKIDDRTLTSQFKKKDEAFKEYNAALQRGDGAYLLDQADRSDDTFVLSVGRLPPGKECVVSINYVCTLDSVSETKQRLLIPMSLFPRYNPNPESTVGTTAPPEKYAATVSYKAALDAKIETLGKVKSVSSVSHPIAVIVIGDKSVQVTFGTQQQPVDRDLVIDIELQNNPQHHVFVERVDGDQYVGMYSFIPEFEKGDHKVQSELIFLVDCSGSMGGDRIEDAKRAMQIFLRSIPEGCYFNFYRFGSSYESLFPKSKLYAENTFKAAQKYADATSANLGGTEILEPLKKIFATAPVSGFSRQLFVLTDGEVFNTEEVINIVKKNASSSRVFSFGIGDSCSRSLVNGIALAGNGKSEYCKHGEILEDKIGRHLERALQPAVVQASVSWEGVKNVQQVPYVLPPVFRGDRQIAYAFFEMGDTEQTPKVVLQLKDQLKNETGFVFPIGAGKDQGVANLAARALIKYLETTPTETSSSINSGSLQKRNVEMPDTKKEETDTESDSDTDTEIDTNKDAITDISLKYGVMSKYVSLLAIEKRESGKAKEIELREIPVQVPMSMSHRPMWRGGGGCAGGAPRRMLATRAYGGPPPRRMLATRACSRGGGAAKRAWPVPATGGVQKRARKGTNNAMECDDADTESSDDFDDEKAEMESSEDSEDQEVEKKRMRSGDAPKKRKWLGALEDWSDTDFSEDEEPDVMDATPKPVLNQVLDLQQWNGSWEFSGNLESNLGATKEAAEKVAGEKMDSAVLATLLVVAYLNAKHAGQVHIWQAIANKALTFIRKHISSEQEETVLKGLQSLF